jgi:hypothetical protein
MSLMSKHTRRLVVVMSILLVMTSTVAAAKPTRTECIIGYDVDWTGIADQRAVRAAILEFVKHKAAATFSSDVSKFYAQYREQCDEKQQISEDMFHALQSKGLVLPKFNRIPDPIEISPSTIDLKGLSWSDTAPTSTDVTGRYPAIEVATGLYQLCNRSDDGSKASCFGYISAAFEIAANNPVDGIASCLRTFRNVSAIRTLTLTWIAAHPEKAQEPASTAIAEAMAEAFPCQKAK